MLFRSLQAAEINVQRSEVAMPDGPIKVLGEHTVSILLHPEVHVSLVVMVEAENDDGASVTAESSEQA